MPEPFICDACREVSNACCTQCGKVQPHTIPRLNRTGRPVLCDACHNGERVSEKPEGKFLE